MLEVLSPPQGLEVQVRCYWLRFSHTECGFKFHGFLFCGIFCIWIQSLLVSNSVVSKSVVSCSLVSFSSGIKVFWIQILWYQNLRYQILWIQNLWIQILWFQCNIHQNANLGTFSGLAPHEDSETPKDIEVLPEIFEFKDNSKKCIKFTGNFKIAFSCLRFCLTMNQVY